MVFDDILQNTHIRNICVARSSCAIRRQEQQRFPNRPATSPSPCFWCLSYRLSKCQPAFSGQHCPRHDKVTGRIANTARTKVDDSR